MRAPCQFCKPHEAQGAERERRRIRRALRDALKVIRSPNSGTITRNYYADIIDAATRAPKGRGK